MENTKEKRNISEIEGNEEQVAQMLDDCYPEVKIGCLTFSPSQIVKECDPVAFRCMVADEPIRYKCDDCNDEFDDEDDANDHWDSEHKDEEGN